MVESPPKKVLSSIQTTTWGRGGCVGDREKTIGRQQNLLFGGVWKGCRPGGGKGSEKGKEGVRLERQFAMGVTSDNESKASRNRTR